MGDRTDLLLIAAADTPHTHNGFDNALWARLAAEFTAERLLDLLKLCGWYHGHQPHRPRHQAPPRTGRAAVLRLRRPGQ